MPTLSLVGEFDTRQAQINQDNLIEGFRTLAEEAARSGALIDEAFGDTSAVDNHTAATQRAENQGKNTSVVMRELKGILPTITTAAVITGVISYANAWNSVQSSVRLSVDDLSQVGAVTSRLNDIASAAGVSVSGVAESFQRYTTATNNLNLSQEETISIVETLTRGFAVYASSSAEAEAASVQLSQAFAKGVLDGDELKSVLEAFSPLGDEIAEVLGVTRGELRELGADGAITAEVLVEAIDNLGGSLDELEEKAGRSVGQALAGLGNAAAELVGRLDDAANASGIFAKAVDFLAGTITEVARNRLPNLREESDLLKQEIALLEGIIEDAGDDLGLFGRIAEGVTGASARLTAAQERLNEVQQKLTKEYAEGAFAANQATSEADAYGKVQLQVSAAVDTVVNDVEGFNNSVREQIEAMADAEAAAENYTGTIQVTEDQLRRLDDVFEEFEEETKDIERRMERLDDVFKDFADETAEAYEKLDGVFDDFVKETERIKEAAEKAELEALEEAFEGISDSIGDLLGLSGGQVEAFFGNFGQLLRQLGLDFDVTFAGIAQAVEEAFGISAAQLDGFLGLAVEGLDILGFKFDDIFGKKATSVIERFAGLSKNEIGVLGDLLGGVGDIFGGLFGQVEGEGVASFNALGIAGGDALGGLSTEVDNLINDVFGLTDAVGGANQGFGSLLGNIGAAGAALGALGVGTQQLVSGLGFSDSAALGAGIGNVIFPGLGGIAGGLIGGLGFGGGNERRGNERDAAEELRQFFAAGGSATSGDILAGLDADIGANVLNRQIREFELLRDAFASVTTEIGELQISSEFVLRALGDQAGTTAGVIAEEFGISAIDVAAAINSLPPDVRASFDSLAANSDEVAELLAQRFGISVEAVKVLLDDLAVLGDQALRNIGSSSDAAAIELANTFGIGVDQVRAFLGTLDPAALASFEAIRANSDDLAAQIAGAFGLSVEEVKAILADLGVVGQTELERVATGSEQAAQNISQSFAATGLDINAIFGEIAAQGSTSFGEIVENADGSFSLVDASAQERLANIVTAFGGTQADVQAILEILGQNGIDTFDQIAIGADGSFEVIRLSGSASLEALVEQFAGTGEATGVILEGIGNDGVLAFDTIAEGADGAFIRIGDVSEETLQTIQEEFAASEGTISELLQILANNGAISFGELGDAGTISADDIAAAFDAAGGDAAGALALLQSQGSSVFAAVQASGVGSANAIAAAFNSSAAAARGSIGGIIAEAQRASSIINSIPAVPSVPGAAFGGLITEPVRLSSSQPFGRSGFASGGILPGLTAIGGGSGLFHAVAGEGGRPEAIVPLEQTSRGLGVNATGLGGNSLTQVIIIEGVDRAETDRIKQRLAATNASIETRATRAAANLLLGRT